MAIKKNFIYNLVGSIIPLLVGLIAIPIYLKLIGEERFGVLSIVWLILGYFSLFNLGMGKAITVELSSKKNHWQDSGEIFFTAISLNLFFALLAILLFYGLYLIFGIPIKADLDIINELRNSIFWLSLILPLAIVGSIFSGVLLAYEKFLLSNTISTITASVSFVIPILTAYYYSDSLEILIPVIFSLRLISTLVLFFIALKLINAEQMTFSRAVSKRLLSFGGWVTLSSTIGPIMVILDRVIISYLQGAKFVTYYTVPYQLTEKINIIASSITNTIYPKFAKLEPEQANLLAVKSLSYLLALNTPLIIIGIFLLKPFLSLWISVDFANNSNTVAEILLISVWINGLAFIPDTFLQATGKPAVNAKVHTIEVLPYLALLYFCLKYWGIEGAAIATGVRFFADFILLSYFSGLIKSLIKICIKPILLVFIAFISSFYLNIWTQVLIFLILQIALFAIFKEIYTQNYYSIKSKLIK